MNLTQFQTLSKRTMPFGGEPANQVEFKNMLGNYAMGLVGEVIELLSETTKDNPDINEIKLEIGDVMHYAVGLISCLGSNVDFERMYNSESNEALFYVGEILELTKKHIYHRHELTKENIVELIYKTMKSFYLLEPEIKMSEVFELNINKLKTRYPDKFSVEDSIKRVDVNG